MIHLYHIHHITKAAIRRSHNEGYRADAIARRYKMPRHDVEAVLDHYNLAWRQRLTRKKQSVQ